MLANERKKTTIKSTEQDGRMIGCAQLINKASYQENFSLVQCISIWKVHTSNLSSVTVVR
jgi:hypothetical protein